MKTYTIDDDVAKDLRDGINEIEHILSLPLQYQAREEYESLLAYLKEQQKTLTS